jgi:hypothetical protein
MTLMDHLIPARIWFNLGYGEISIVMSAVSMGMSFVTLLTVKGINVPLWLIGVIGMAVMIVAVTIGYFYQRYNITGRMNSHFNRTMNPEINDIHQDLKLIKKQLGIPEVKK